MATKKKKAAKAVNNVFEKDGKNYALDLSIIPKDQPFGLPGTTTVHTLEELLVDEKAQAICIKYGIATEVSEEDAAGDESGEGGEGDPE